MYFWSAKVCGLEISVNVHVCGMAGGYDVKGERSDSRNTWRVKKGKERGTYLQHYARDTGAEALCGDITSTRCK